MGLTRVEISGGNDANGLKGELVCTPCDDEDEGVATEKLDEDFICCWRLVAGCEGGDTDPTYWRVETLTRDSS